MNKRKIIERLCWILYFVVLTYLVLFKYSLIKFLHIEFIMDTGIIAENTNIHLNLFQNISLFFSHWNLLWSKINILFNIVAFSPIGVLVARKWKSKKIILVTLIMGLGISLTYETIQIVFHIGDFDVDDIFLNTLGAVLGLGIYCAVFGMHRKLKSE